MKKAVLTLVLLCGNSLSLLARSDSAGQQLLTTATQQANLLHDRTSPLELEVDFVAQLNVPEEGHLTLKWKDKNQWWRRVAMGNFEQIDIKNGEMLYTLRSTGFTPVRIGELLSLLQFPGTSEGLTVTKKKERKENGVEMTCLRVEGESRGKHHDLCINSVSQEILRNEWQEPPDEKRVEEYSDYREFEGRRYASRLQLLVNGMKVLTATVVNIASTPFEPALLVPPKGAIERRKCEGWKHAIPMKTPDPAYPKSASENRMMGDTTVAMTVQIDGSVSDIQLIGSAVRSMDEATLQTLKSWRFRPAMCGTQPVVSDIEVVVSFRLN